MKEYHAEHDEERPVDDCDDPAPRLKCARLGQRTDPAADGTLNPRLTAEPLAYTGNRAEDQVVIVDDSLVPLLAPVLPQISSVHTVVGTGGVDLAPLRRDGVTVVGYEEFISAQPETFDRPDIDEHSAAAMRYTSGTTGNPKGVAYSHRSTYLHSMAACAVDGLRVTCDDRILTIVPMFHVNAWGLVHSVLMAGADLLMPDRFLQAEPLVRLIDAQKPTIAGAVPTIWNDVLNFLEAKPGHDVSSLGLVVCGGSAVLLHVMQIFEEKYGVQIVQAWGMTETSPLAAIARPPASFEPQEQWRLRATQGRPVAGVERRLVDDAGNELRTTAERSVSCRCAVPGSLAHTSVRRTAGKSFKTAGCAPATSVGSTHAVS